MKLAQITQRIDARMSRLAGKAKDVNKKIFKGKKDSDGGHKATDKQLKNLAKWDAELTVLEAMATAARTGAGRKTKRGKKK